VSGDSRLFPLNIENILLRTRLFLSTVTTLMLIACGGSSSSPGVVVLPPLPTPPPGNAAFQNVSVGNLPASLLGGLCMDADHGDVDGDGDVDLALAQEHATNLILLNDGSGVFSVLAGAVTGGTGDNEDVRLPGYADRA